MRPKHHGPPARLYPADPFKPRSIADWREFYEERAAIAEYLGGMPRQQAERFALELAGPMPHV